MKKCLVLILVILILLPIAVALKDCKPIISSRDVPCMIITAYQYPNTCNTYTVKIYNETPSLLDTRNLGDYGGIRCNLTFNYSQRGSYLLNFSSGDSASIVVEEVDNIDLAIIIGLVALIALGAFFTMYLDNALKLVFFLGTSLLTVFSINVLANLAAEAGVAAHIVKLIWLAYQMGLYLFLALFFYVLIKLMVELKIRKNVPPNMGSPLQRAKADRKARKNGYYN